MKLKKTGAGTFVAPVDEGSVESAGWAGDRAGGARTKSNVTMAVERESERITRVLQAHTADQVE
jgi:hypothetical protein